MSTSPDATSVAPTRPPTNTGTSTNLGTPKQPDANVAQAAKPAPLATQTPATPLHSNGAAAPSACSLSATPHSLLLGLDGGGTSTRAALADSSGKILAIAKTDIPSTLQHAGKTGASTAFDTAVNAAFALAKIPRQPAAAAFLGIAGVVRPADNALICDIAKSLNLAPKIAADHDVRIANTGGLTGRPGIALIAGTGSSCYGTSTDSSGKQNSLLVGGWGFIADDEGSAGWIGLRALNYAVRQSDQRLPGSTSIRDAIFSALQLTDPRDFLHRVHDIGLSREQIAALCPLICKLAQAGDSSSLEILQQAANALASLISTTARRLNLANPEVTHAGGLALSGAPFQPLLETAIRNSTPGARIHPPDHPPVIGALIEAARLANIPRFTIRQ